MFEIKMGLSTKLVRPRNITMYIPKYFDNGFCYLENPYQLNKINLKEQKSLFVSARFLSIRADFRPSKQTSNRFRSPYRSNVITYGGILSFWRQMVLAKCDPIDL